MAETKYKGLLFVKFKEFKQKMKVNGWFCFEEALNLDFTRELKTDLHRAYEICRNIQLRNSSGDITEGTVHHLLGQGHSFLRFLEQRILLDYVEEYLQSKIILNSFGGVIHDPVFKLSYVHKIHKDQRPYLNEPIMVNFLVMLDDFTKENGATYFLSGSHLSPDKPEKKVFYELAQQAIAPEGSIVVFDSKVWHSSGVNQTKDIRRLITPMFSRPFIKPQMNFTKLIGEEIVERMSNDLKQLIGYFSRIPENLDEWYQPPEKRYYRSDQDISSV